MPQNPILAAMILGLVCGSALPFGALLGAFMGTGSYFMAALAALGCAALSSALVLDVLARSINSEHIGYFAPAVIVGALIFKGLAYLVDRQGGYLRKPTNSAGFWRAQAQARRKAALKALLEAKVFTHLNSEHIERLLPFLVVRNFPKGAAIYRTGDSSEALYLVEDGEVELLEPQSGGRPIEFLGKNSVFGRLSFITGTRRGTDAVTTADTRVLILPRYAFVALMEEYPELRDALAERLQGAETRSFLADRVGLSPERIAQWLSLSVGRLRTSGYYDSALQAAEDAPGLADFLMTTHGTDFFRNLGVGDRERIAARLIPLFVSKGRVLCSGDESSMPIYLLREGEVSLLDPHDPLHPAVRSGSGVVLGHEAWFGENPHPLQAIASTDCRCLILRQADFAQLLNESQSLREALATHRTPSPATSAGKQPPSSPVDARKTAFWLTRIARGHGEGDLFPALADIQSQVASHRSLTLFILLGILTDNFAAGLLLGADGRRDGVVTLPLVAGIILVNLAAAWSGSAWLRRYGLSLGRILLGWAAPIALIGGLAAAAAWGLPHLPRFALPLTEGLALGAIVGMMMDTLLPEAWQRNGLGLGLPTAVGFLVTLLLASSGGSG